MIPELVRNRVTEQIKKNRVEVIFVKADVSRTEECEQLINKTVEIFAKIDIAFNNAGIGGEAIPFWI